MGGCVSCYKNPSLNPTRENETPKEQKVRKVRRRSLREGFWSSDTFDMENSAFQSQGSMSSISTSNQTLDLQGGLGSASNPPEFVNHGLILWNQTRQRWIGNKRSEKRSHRPQEPRLNWNASYDSLLGSNKPFPRSVPLPEMIDFLVDIWEQEGLYD